METLPAVRSIADVEYYAKIFIESRLFDNSLTLYQACVKIIAGQELGVSPFAAMRGIRIVRGETVIASHLLAALIKRSGKYDYRVREINDQTCSIEFYEQGSSVGVSTFTMDDAKRAKLDTKDNYKNYPSAMLYNRAMGNGARMYAPDIFLGGIYVEDELDTPIVEQTPALPVAQELVYEPEPEPLATPEHLGVLYGQLKRLGVLDGHKSALVHRMYPEPTRAQVTYDISLLESCEALPPAYINAYVQALMEEKSVTRDALKAYMTEKFKTANPTKLGKDDQGILIEWLANGGQDALAQDEPITPEVVEEHYDVAEPNPLTMKWDALYAGLVRGCSHPLEDIQACLLAEYGEGYEASEAILDEMSLLQPFEVDRKVNGWKEAQQQATMT